MKSCNSHMTKAQRIRLKQMLDAGARKPEIALELGVSRSTVYNENCRWTVGGRYDPEYSEERYQKSLLEKGREAILSLNPELASYISELILEEHKSPEQIMEDLRINDKFCSVFSSVNTIYNAIDHGLIPGVTRENLRTNTTTVFHNGQIHPLRGGPRSCLIYRMGMCLAFGSKVTVSFSQRNQNNDSYRR